MNLKLTVESATLTKNKFSYNLYDINGNLVAQKEINDVSTIIPMGELASGMYILRVAQNNAEVRTFKLFKTN